MRSHVRFTAALFVVCVIGVGAHRAAADERRPLPPFTVVAPNGGAVASSQLSTEVRPLLVYVAPDCRACDRLIAALIEWQPSMPANRVVVIVGAAADVARKYAEDRQIVETPAISWYADPVQSAASALGVQHMPALVAVDGGRIEWIVSGVLNEPGALESIVRTWTSR